MRREALVGAALGDAVVAVGLALGDPAGGEAADELGQLGDGAAEGQGDVMREQAELRRPGGEGGRQLDHAWASSQATRRGRERAAAEATEKNVSCGGGNTAIGDAVRRASCAAGAADDAAAAARWRRTATS